MKILYDHQVFSLQDHGGGSVYFYELASRLGRLADIDVDVLLGFNHCLYPFRSLEQFGTRIVGWNIGPGPGLVRYALNEAATGAWCLAAGSWDIYHSTQYRRMPTVRARRTVATNHDCTQERFPELFDDANRVIKAKKRLYEQADAIMCVSESSCKDVLQFYNIDRRKTHVVHQGVPRLVRDPEGARDFAARLRRPFLLSVGARYSYKNFDGLLNAFASGGFARDFDLVVIGGGALNSAELSQIQRLELSDTILHFAFVNESILAEAYSRAALFVSPSLYEGFGLPPLEALSLSCPVLASNSASIPEICGDAALYFDPAIPGDMERGIRDALNDPNREQRMIMGIRRAARYSWQTNAEKTLEVYRSL
jgi:glycosyltransferase involved in cell wall biosynthesis